MRKMLAGLLSLAIAAALCACGGNSARREIAVFWYDQSDTFLRSVRTALNRELDVLGVSYENFDAGNDQETQLNQIKTALSQGTDLLLVNQVASGSTRTAEEILQAAGATPVIFFNRAIGTDGSELPFFQNHANACFIGTDAPQAGHMQGQMIGKYLLAHYDEVDVNGDGILTYALMMGDENNAEAIDRTRYAVADANALLTAGGKPPLAYFNIYSPQTYQADKAGQWSAEAAKKYMDGNFRDHNEANGNLIELVICNNDSMAEGVIASLQSNGYNKTGAHVVPVFGVDATDAARNLIREGAMTGTVKQNAEGMAAALAETSQYILGGTAPAQALASLHDPAFVPWHRIPEASCMWPMPPTPGGKAPDWLSRQAHG